MNCGWKFGLSRKEMTGYVMGRVGVSASGVKPKGEDVRLSGLSDSVVEIERERSEMVWLEILDRGGVGARGLERIVLHFESVGVMAVMIR